MTSATKKLDKTFDVSDVFRDISATVRVFVPTYRRNALLRRAIESLRAQTCGSWVCEIHNDDPADEFPAMLVDEIGDPRIALFQHDRNLGAAETFNLFYRATTEPYYSILEDDNWWEPEFLSTMLREMEAHPNVELAWCNQRIWEELPDGSWRDTGRSVGPLDVEGSHLICFGNTKQVTGALHSNGAMLLRSRSRRTYRTPGGWPFAAVEPFRERMVPHPLLYVGDELAIFACTLRTTRSNDRTDWMIAQTFLAASFIKNLKSSIIKISDVVMHAQTKYPRETNALIYAAILEPSCRKVLSCLGLTDWLLFIRGLIRRPQILWRVIRAWRRNAEWLEILDRSTAQRFSELSSRIPGINTL